MIPIPTAEEMLRIARKTYSYSGAYDRVHDLLDAFVQEAINPRHPPSDPSHDLFVSHYGTLFLFECGRIYGIRQERARNKQRREAHALRYMHPRGRVRFADGREIPLLSMHEFINTLEGNNLYATCKEQARKAMRPYYEAKAAWEEAQGCLPAKN